MVMHRRENEISFFIEKEITIVYIVMGIFTEWIAIMKK